MPTGRMSYGGSTTREAVARGQNRRQSSEPPAPEPRQSRAFGATALHDEAVLDIPAYLRRNALQDA
jgi:hypothetical protein